MATEAENQTSTILVVDDNEGNRSLARNTLEDEGYRVVLASNGSEGIAAFAKYEPDCVLLDVRMPDLDGFAVCERIRALPRGKETPILFLTALRDIDTFDRAVRAGGDDFVTKPVRPSELVIRVQRALKLRNLSDEVRAHDAALRQQRDDMIRLQLQKERLTAFVVHDLKNPVNAMDLHAQLLLRDRTLSTDSRQSVLQIRSEARQLTRMILNLLDLSKADEGKLSPKRAAVDVHALVRDVISELEVSAEHRNVRLENDLRADSMNADADLLRRTLANLVENAIRHAPRGSAVVLSIALRDGETDIRVADAGAGVPADMREAIFDAFVQMEGDGRPRTGGGRGLGLTFCRLVAEAHGGRVWVEDAAPGAIFCMRLPYEN